MTTITAPDVQPHPAATDSEPINLYKLGMLFVIKCRYWSCRAGNDPDELDLTPDRIDARAIASFGTKDLLEPETTRKRFQQLEKRRLRSTTQLLTAWVFNSRSSSQLTNPNRRESGVCAGPVGGESSMDRQLRELFWFPPNPPPTRQNPRMTRVNLASADQAPLHKQCSDLFVSD